MLISFTCFVCICYSPEWNELFSHDGHVLPIERKAANNIPNLEKATMIKFAKESAFVYLTLD